MKKDTVIELRSPRARATQRRSRTGVSVNFMRTPMLRYGILLATTGLGMVFALGQPPPDWQIHAPAGLPDRFQPPDGIRWDYFRNADNARIRYSHVPASAGKVKATIVLVHG